jgi:hypothetical protein
MGVVCALTLLACPATFRLMYTGYRFSDNHIYGPRGYTGYWLLDNHVYSRSGYTGFHISDDQFYGSGGYSGYYVSDGYIYGPEARLPWSDDDAPTTS